MNAHSDEIKKLLYILFSDIEYTLADVVNFYESTCMDMEDIIIYLRIFKRRGIKNLSDVNILIELGLISFPK